MRDLDASCAVLTLRMFKSICWTTTVVPLTHGALGSACARASRFPPWSGLVAALPGAVKDRFATLLGRHRRVS
eukprot:12078123-Alexandrium_andersonii.AAC.1